MAQLDITKPDDSVERYKAYLVIKGYTQQERVSFTKAFSLVAKPI